MSPVLFEWWPINLIKLKNPGKWTAIFFLGLITGAISINLLIGKNLDKAYMEIQNLKSQTTDQQVRIEALQAELSLRQPSLVKEIRAYVIEEDKFVKMELESAVKDLLKDLNGKEVGDLDPILVANVLNDRLIEIDETTYSLEVEALLISEKILVYVKPHKREESASGSNIQTQKIIPMHRIHGI